MLGATLLAVWLASSILGLGEAECSGDDCSEETCPCVLMLRMRHLSTYTILCVTLSVAVRIPGSVSAGVTLRVHVSRRYANGPSSKAKREETPYEMYALGSDEPKFCAETNTIAISVGFNTTCAHEAASFGIEHLVGKPGEQTLNVIVPLRAPDACATPGPSVWTTARVDVPVPRSAVVDTRPMFVAFPPDSEFDIFMVRENVKESDAPF
eukprot:COSAG02_NODE_143_length_34133_cov_272.981282_3_plen_210_part_00